MKNWTLLALTVLFLSGPSALYAQIYEALKDLEGVWYMETRNSITYSTWQNNGNQTFENQTLSIICRDTVLLSSAVLQYSEDSASLLVISDGKPQRYRLVSFAMGQMVWENESPDGLPKNIQWKFLRGGYATFISDGIASSFRRDSRQLLKLRFRAALGANVNKYANPVGDNRFLANINVSNIQGTTEMLSGGEAALSLGLIFPATPMCLNFELGMAYRQVGVQASFYHPKAAAFTERDGYYRNYNYYFALVPEVFVGKKRNFSLTAGFYADIFQQCYFRGHFGIVNADTPPTLYTHPGKDIDFERGLIVGLHYRLTSLERYRPQAYLRYTHGINNTQVRAISLGVAVEFEMQ